jgi:error-prone DNA polymerase
VLPWDKDDVDELGLFKMDVLGLGMLTCIRKALALVNERSTSEAASTPAADGSSEPTGGTHGATAQAAKTKQTDPRPPAFTHPLALHTIPAEDPAVYDALCAADTIGVFQVESRAQLL